MTKNILKNIICAKEKGEKLLAILLDPDKLKPNQLSTIIKNIEAYSIHFIFVGGSSVKTGDTDLIVKKIKQLTSIPVVLFPGDYTQLTNEADSVLLLSLLSGRNPEFLIEQQLKSVNFLKSSKLEIIPTGYILIDGGVEAAVQRISKTLPIQQTSKDEIVNTALAAQFMGKDLVYLEAGSGATEVVDPIIIKSVSHSLTIPIIVGGGIRTKIQLNNAYENGADLVVIGTAFEENNDILTKLK